MTGRVSGTCECCRDGTIVAGTVSELVQLVRGSVGLSQAELASAAGSYQGSVSDCEHVKLVPHVPTLARWLAAADFDLGFLAVPRSAGVAGRAVWARPILPGRGVLALEDGRQGLWTREAPGSQVWRANLQHGDTVYLSFGELLTRGPLVDVTGEDRSRTSGG